MEPAGTPGFLHPGGWALPNFGSLQTVRLAFKGGKSFADMTGGSIRLMTVGELGMTNLSSQVLLFSGTDGFSYGLRTGGPDTLAAPTIDLELPDIRY